VIVRTLRNPSFDREWFPCQPSSRHSLGCNAFGISLLGRHSSFHMGMCDRHCSALAPHDNFDASLERCGSGAARTVRVRRAHRRRSIDNSECCHDGANCGRCSGQTKGSTAEWIIAVDSCDLDLDDGSGRSSWLCADGAPCRLAALSNNTKGTGFMDSRCRAVDEGGRA
jgi:hypothetical protein